MNSHFRKRRSIFKTDAFFISHDEGGGIILIKTTDQYLFLKTEVDTETPYITFREWWKDERKVSYEYRFTLPFVKISMTHDKEYDKGAFEFRYEKHLDRNPLIPHWPQDHLHVLSQAPPKFPSTVDFNDFLEIVERNFFPASCWTYSL